MAISLFHRKSIPLYSIVLFVTAVTFLSIPVQAQSLHTLTVSCQDRFPPPPIKVKRKVGDTDVFTFTVTATTGTLSNIHWDYPQNHTAEEWGTWVVNPSSTLTWNPPQNDGLKAAGVFHVGVSGNISCGGSGGAPLTFATSINGEVFAKHWKPEPDITGGVMIAPQNQTATPTPAHVMTRVRNTSSGDPVPCEVSEATDLDTWEVLDETDTEEDDVTYTWSASGGTFDDPEHPGTLKDVVKGRTTQWYAPENIVGYFTLTCTIDDKPKEIENPPESGRRDDPKIVRTVEVMVVSIHIDPNRLVLESGSINKQTYDVSVYPPEAAQYIRFEQVSGSGSVSVTFDGSHLTITGQSEGNFTLNAKSIETDQLMGAFGGKVLGENDSPPGPPDLWPDLDPVPPVPPHNGPPNIIWSPIPPISGGDILSPEGGQKTIKPGKSVFLQVASAGDNDTRYVTDNPPALVSAEVSYEWKDQDGKTADKSGSLSVDPNDHTKATWTAPTKEGTYTITCTLVDGDTSIAEGEYGSRDDDDVERHFTITVQEDEPDVNTGGDIRAAAGHIDNSVHKATINIITKDKDTGDPIAATLYLTFEGNKGSEDAKRAKFYLGPNLEDQVEELTVTTDPVTGNASVTVISSDVISQDIKVKVEWKDSQDNYKDVGSVTCDFGEVISKRRFGIILPPSHKEGKAEDHGWEFPVYLLVNDDDFTPATIYLKFPKTADQKNDAPYFDNDDNVISPLPDADDWPPVEGHKLRISFGGASSPNGAITVDKNLVYFTNSDGTQLASLSEDGKSIVYAPNTPENWANYSLPPYLPVTTGAEGTATVYIHAGLLIYQCETLKLRAREITQKKEN